MKASDANEGSAEEQPLADADGALQSGVVKTATRGRVTGDLEQSTLVVPKPPPVDAELPQIGAQLPLDEAGSSGAWKGLLLPDDADKDALIGQTLCDSYIIDAPLGEGGMGRVFAARHTRIKNKRFAVKTLHQEFLRRSELLERFQREAEAAAAIASPHVVGVFDVGRCDDGRPFIVSEYLDGEELGELLERQPKLGIAQAVGIVRQVCRGLAAAHECGVVHRDIKPENVFLVGDSGNPHAKVLDFGIARIDDGQKSLTKTGVLVGTPSYMSPEQAQGHAIDRRTDIYSLGVMLYAMLTGQVPFERADAQSTIVAVLTADALRPSELEPSISQHLELVIQKAMAREPDERFQTMTDFADALERYDDRNKALRMSDMIPGSKAQGVGQEEGGKQDSHAARRRLVTMLAVMSLAILFGGVSSAGDLLGALGVQLSGLNLVLVCTAVLGVSAAPAVWALARLRTQIWNNTPKVLALSHELQRAGAIAALWYATGSLSLRFGQQLGAATKPLSTAIFGLFLFVAALVGGGASYWVGKRWKDKLWNWAVGGLLAVGMAIACAQLLHGEEKATASPGASERRGVAVKTTPSAAPSAVPPDPIEVAEFEALSKNSKLHPKALAKARALLTRSPDVAKSKRFQTALTQLLMHGGKLQVATIELMSTRMGSDGPDLMYRLWIQQRSLRPVLRDALVGDQARASASPALRIAVDVQFAEGCAEKAALVERAGQHGDARTIVLLNAMSSSSRRGCGLLKMKACPVPCPQQAPKFRKTIQKIHSRLRSR